jgi:hypothetical protein
MENFTALESFENAAGFGCCGATSGRTAHEQITRHDAEWVNSSTPSMIVLRQPYWRSSRECGHLVELGIRSEQSVPGPYYHSSRTETSSRQCYRWNADCDRQFVTNRFSWFSSWDRKKVMISAGMVHKHSPACFGALFYAQCQLHLLQSTLLHYVRRCYLSLPAP